jgi:hypothetical protein
MPPPHPPPAPRLTADDLRRLPDPAATPPACACAHLRCAGWESLTTPLGEPLLRHLGSLRDLQDAEPTVQELHEAGSRYDSPHAPIAPAWFPYNRCELWACRACGRGLLQYTEFGGYYVDHRVREVHPQLVRG